MRFAVYPMPRARTGFMVDVQSRLFEGLAGRRWSGLSRIPEQAPDRAIIAGTEGADHGT